MTDIPTLAPAPIVLQQFQLTPEAQERINDALMDAALIGKVANQAQQRNAVEVQIELKRIAKDIEAVKDKLLQPAKSFTQQVKAAADEACTEVAREYQRLFVLVSEYDQKHSAELAEKADKIKADYDAEVLAAAGDAGKVRAAAEKFNERSAQLEASRPAGQLIRRDWEVEVTDIRALYAAFPDCVKLSPKLTEIKELLEIGVKLPGVTAEKKTKSHVRTGGAIEV